MSKFIHISSEKGVKFPGRMLCTLLLHQVCLCKYKPRANRYGRRLSLERRKPEELNSVTLLRTVYVAGFHEQRTASVLVQKQIQEIKSEIYNNNKKE